jgi:hypothetical protein
VEEEAALVAPAASDADEFDLPPLPEAEQPGYGGESLPVVPE